MEGKETIALATSNQVDHCHSSSFSPWNCKPLLCLWAFEVEKEIVFTDCARVVIANYNFSGTAWWS